jgi:succinate dehydrogenase / fumarate reductase cytochrome b subunit
MKSQDNRPLSPHLQIYRLPFAAILSITHRATGVILSMAALSMIWVLAAAASGSESYSSIYIHFSTWYGQIFLIGVTLSLYMHLCNGIRHLFWDAGLGFELETAAISAKAAIAGAVVLTSATWLIALNVG